MIIAKTLTRKVWALFGRIWIVRVVENLKDSDDTVLVETQADVLVAPSYKVISRLPYMSNQSISVVVSGYPGKYTNFRPVPEVADFDVQELSGDYPYIIISKDDAGKSVNYKVVSDFRRNTLDLDLDAVSVDKVVIGKCNPKKQDKK